MIDKLFYKAVLLISVLLLNACGGGVNPFSLQAGGVGSGGTGMVFYGAPAIDSVVLALNDALKEVATTSTDQSGNYSIQLPEKGVYLLRASLSNGDQWHSIITVDTAQQVRSNISPVSELVTALALQKDPLKVSSGDLQGAALQIESATTTATALLKPLLSVQDSLLRQAGYSSNEQAISGILKAPFALNNEGLDGVIDRLLISKNSNAVYAISSPSAPSVPTVQLKADASDLNAALQQVQASTYLAAVDSARTALIQTPAALVLPAPGLLTAQGQDMALWVPQSQASSWTLSFETAALTTQLQLSWSGDIGTAYTQNITTPNGRNLTRYVIQGRTGHTLPANSTLVWRVQATANATLPTTLVDIRNCQFNGQACSVRYLDADSSKSLNGLLESYGRTDATRLSEQIKTKWTASSGTTAISTPTMPLSNTATAAQNGQLELTWDIETEWDGGYGGVLRVKNVSNRTIEGSSWSLLIPVSLSRTIFAQGPWNMAVLPKQNGLEVTPASTQANLLPGENAVSGYMGTEITQLCPLLTYAETSPFTLKLGTRMFNTLKTRCAASDNGSSTGGSSTGGSSTGGSSTGGSSTGGSSTGGSSTGGSSTGGATDQSTATSNTGLRLTWDLGTQWATGYTSTLTITNVSLQTIRGDAWTFPLATALPENLFAQGPWNMRTTRDQQTQQFTLLPAQTQPNLLPGQTAVSDYQGHQVIQLCPLKELVKHTSAIILTPFLAQTLALQCTP